ncbi:MAG: HAD-IIIC family phosphatase [Gammaproteobacteria bacterium]|nr:HAD-IIIC family phosphatase [Gammaproteobacteria bacterium]
MLKFDQICQIVSDSAANTQLPPLNIAILRNVTLNPLETYLHYFAYRAGFQATITLGEYDNVMQEVMVPSTQLLHGDTDLVVLFLQLATLSPLLLEQFATLSNADREAAVKHVLDYVNTAISAIRQRSSAAIIFPLFELPCYPQKGVYDLSQSDGQIHTINALNREIINLQNQFSDLYFIDLNFLLMRLGSERFYDERFWHIGRQPYSLEAIAAIAAEINKVFSALKGLTKKCLVLDCDNTLWGGILGEEGIDNIQLGDSYPGCAFREFQQQIVNLTHQGVIIALCSKNNPEEVDEVFTQHREMLLKPHHIALKRVNWQSKAENIRQISNELNIGLEHIVFVDDSPFEINLVKQQLPMVSVIQVDHEAPEQSARRLLSSGYFDKLSTTQEDKKRGQFYLEESKRRTANSKFTSLADYLRSLNMELEIDQVTPHTVARAAQLTQRTNQFNLTTKRYTEENIAALVADESSDVISVRLKDKFGDLGIIAAAIVLYEEEHAVVDSFSLSCRALSRGVEDALLYALIQRIVKKGSKQIVAAYCPTKKNRQVENFYPERGFQLMEERSNSGQLLYRYAVDADVEIANRFHGKIALSEN